VALQLLALTAARRELAKTLNLQFGLFIEPGNGGFVRGGDPSGEDTVVVHVAPKEIAHVA
jgi:hypothetical protein